MRWQCMCGSESCVPLGTEMVERNIGRECGMHMLQQEPRNSAVRILDLHTRAARTVERQTEKAQ